MGLVSCLWKRWNIFVNSLYGVSRTWFCYFSNLRIYAFRGDLSSVLLQHLLDFVTCVCESIIKYHRNVIYYSGFW